MQISQKKEEKVTKKSHNICNRKMLKPNKYIHEEGTAMIFCAFDQ